MVEIPLSRGKIAVVDDADADLRAFKWSTFTSKRSKTFYAYRTVRDVSGQRHSLYLHRVIGARLGLNGHVDHRDGNGLNCKRDNLRTATRSQNMANQPKQKNNSSGFKGVMASRGRWRASIESEGVRYGLGTFDTAELAARAYDDAARSLHGEFACANSPSNLRGTRQGTSGR